MTYNVFGGTLSLTQSIMLSSPKPHGLTLTMSRFTAPTSRYFSFRTNTFSQSPHLFIDTHVIFFICS